MKYAHFAELVFGVPLAIEPLKLDTILRGIGPRLGLADLGPAPTLEGAPASRAPYSVTNGVAVLDVMGSLVQRSLGVNAFSGLTSYDQLSAELDAAVADPFVKSILLRIDSGGGAAAGAFDLADKIAAVDAIKPVVALAEDKALSAAYLLASAAREVYVTQSGLLGSIGVVLARLDTSAADAADGRKVTLITAGARKADGNPAVPMTDDELAALQASVYDSYALFVGKVAAARGMSEADVRATDAGVFSAPRAIDLGLADGIQTLQGLIAQMSSGAAPRGAKSYRVGGMVPSLATAPAGARTEGTMPTGTKEVPQVAGGEVVDLASLKARLDASESRNAALESDLAKLKAKAELDAAAIAATEKEAVIAKHRARNAIVPAMLPAVNKLAEIMSAAELDKALEGYPEHPALARVDVPVAAAKDGAADSGAFELDAKAKELAEKFGWDERELAQVSGVRTIRMTEDGPRVTFDGGKRIALRDLNKNMGRA